MKYRQRIPEVEAMVLGESQEDIAAARRLCGSLEVIPDKESVKFAVETREGRMEARAGAWLVKDSAGDFYFSKPENFEANYELIPAWISPG